MYILCEEYIDNEHFFLLIIFFLKESIEDDDREKRWKEMNERKKE